jgi:hypothetical protein
VPSVTGVPKLWADKIYSLGALRDHSRDYLEDEDEDKNKITYQARRTEEKISKNSGGYYCGYTKQVYQ